MLQTQLHEQNSFLIEIQKGATDKNIVDDNFGEIEKCKFSWWLILHLR